MKRFLSTAGYANITATLALVVALGGTGYAAVHLPKHSVGGKQLKKNAVSSKKVKDDSLTGADLDEGTLATVPGASTLGGRTLRGISQWVLVDDDGTVVQQSGGITVAVLMNGTAQFRVSFPTDVSSCGLNANTASATPVPDGGLLQDVRVSVARSTTGARDVQVRMHDQNGLANPAPFYLTVQC